MSVPLQTQLFDAFLGTQEGIHSSILPDIFSSGGSKNVFIDKYARVKKISGYTKQNSSARTTNSGASTAIFRNLFHYKQTAGGSITRRLVGVLDDGTNEWEIWYSTDQGVNWTFLYDAGSGPVGQVGDMAQFGDDLFITNGKVAPRKLTGTSIAAAGLTRSPTPTAAAGSAGLLNGDYRYKLVSMVGETRQIGSASSTNLPLQDLQGSLSWTADSNVSVTGYEVYRTTGTGVTFYFVGYVNLRATTSYTDNTPDSTIVGNRVLLEHGDAPPTSYFCEPHKGRMWWLRTDTNPTRAYWSDAGLADSVYSFNYLDFSDSELQGDQITGAFGNFGQVLVVFTNQAIWTVSGTGAVIGAVNDWTRSKSNAQVGSVAGRSVVRVPAGSKYQDETGTTQTITVNSLAYFTPLGDIRIFDGKDDKIISHPIKTTLSDWNYAGRSKVHAVHDTANQQIIWFFPTGSDTECVEAVCWSYKWGVWYPWPSMPMSASVEVDSTSAAAVLLSSESLITKGGYVYKLLDGNSFDGSNINAVWMTKTLRGIDETGKGVPAQVKRWRWADVVFKVSSDVALTLEWMPGYATDDASGVASTIIQPSPATILTSDGYTVVSADADSIVVSLESSQGKVILHTLNGDYLHDTGLRIRISDNDDLGSWALEAMTIAYQVLPGNNRRNQS
jgi:hypothetical protein